MILVQKLVVRRSGSQEKQEKSEAFGMILAFLRQKIGEKQNQMQPISTSVLFYRSWFIPMSRSCCYKELLINF
jgi:hypothetical protein